MTNPNTPLSIRKATLHDIPVIQNIAYNTWPAAYGEILSEQQLSYMLELIYSPSSLSNQLNEGHQYFIAEIGNEPVGFCDFGFVKDDTYKLHKIYVLPTAQKTGAGKALLNVAIESVKDSGGDTLILNVNRHNNAKDFYRKMGFSVSYEEDIDIGEGYFMNDYVMKLDLRNPTK
jgi:ribosomal protein S18 acetylase RimI-like enzyme